MSHRLRRLLIAGLIAAAGSPAAAQVIGRDGRLIYQPDMSISRALTPIEREWLRTHTYVPPGSGLDLVTPPPTGPIHCAAEYEPMEGLIITWVGGQTAIQGQLGRWTTTTGNAELWVVLPNAATQASAASTLTSAGANMSRVHYVVPPAIDSVWVRDYGPRYIFEGDCRAIVDHQYNRPRPNDDVFPGIFGAARGHQLYALGLNNTQLIHGGGNFHLDALDRSYATRLTVNENPTLTEPLIVSIWGTYQGLQHTFFQPFPTSIDATQHLDMWMQVIADDKVIISDWPSNAGSTQDQICDNAAVFMAGRGYTVYRVPAFSIGAHYTYTNMVMCNDVVMLPSYNQATVAPSNAVALATLQSALPGKTIVQINCDNIIGLAGAIHCIVMHVPAHRGQPGPAGGPAPTAYLKTPNGGQHLAGGQNYAVSWISDDDTLVASVDLFLSTDGGLTYPTPIATGQPRLGTFNWTVPNIDTSSARIRVVARDAPGNTGADASDGNFIIGTPCYANCDDSTASPLLNVNDFICFQQRFAAGNMYADCDLSTTLNVNDFVCFQTQFAGGCP